MSKQSILFAAFLFCLGGLLHAQKADPEGDKVIGLWLTGSKKAHIQITRYGDKYGGKIVWLRDPNEASGKPKLDSKNPDEKSRKATMLGLNNLLGFKHYGK